jgi:hypothetical protein
MLMVCIMCVGAGSAGLWQVSHTPRHIEGGDRERSREIRHLRQGRGSLSTLIGPLFSPSGATANRISFFKHLPSAVVVIGCFRLSGVHLCVTIMHVYGDMGQGEVLSVTVVTADGVHLCVFSAC